MTPYEYVTDAARLPAIAREVASASVLAEDFETTGFSPILDEPRLWSINTGKGVYVIDVFKTGRPEPVIQAHRNNPKAVIAGQNLKFDQKFALYHYDLEFPNPFDCFRASNLMWNGRGGLGHNLWDLYRRELKISPETEDLGGSDWKASELSRAQLDYAAEDVFHLFRLREVLKPKLAQANLNKIAYIEFQAILPESAVELNGFYLNPKAWRELYNENKIRHGTLANVLWDKLPDPNAQMTLPGFKSRWNIDSTQQMLQALRRIGIKQKIKDPETHRTMTVQLMDTNQITLAMLSDQWPIINDVLDYREVATQLKMFGLDHLNWINPVTHRVHPEYWPFLKSGRYAPQKPNLGQIPRDKRFRKCFQAEEGNLLVLADYSAVEMRVAAEVSGDEVLRQVFRGGEDPHYFTAGVLTGKEKKDITKAERQNAKAVNFGLCIAEGELVLTHVGLVPIEKVQDWHLVWDGVEWVFHEGVVCMGVKEVITHDGLTATPDHEVYTDDGYKVSMLEAASDEHPRRLSVGAVGRIHVRYGYDGRNDGISEPQIRSSARRRVAPVYDILNAGPRHRFTVSGVVVSNCFGMGADKLVLYARANYGVVLTLQEATRIRDKYFQRFSGLRVWHTIATRDGAREHIAKTLWGRLRFLDGDFYTEYLNHPVQGSAADGLKRGLKCVYERLKKLGGVAPCRTKSNQSPAIRMVHHVHDEILTEVLDKDGLPQRVKHELEAGMVEGIQPILPHVPAAAEGSVGKTWADKS